MKLFEISFASFVYKNLTSYQESYCDFRYAVGWNLDLENDAHFNELFRWLNRWGCRLPGENKETIRRAVRGWYSRYGNVLPRRTSLWRLPKSELEKAVLLYGELCSSEGLRPTAASKVLFAVWPKSLVPWDSAIRKGLSLDGTASSYLAFLQMVRSDLIGLGGECKKGGLKLSELPGTLDREEATAAQLAGEHYWVTRTRKCPMPDQAMLEQWLSWNC